MQLSNVSGLALLDNNKSVLVVNKSLDVQLEGLLALVGTAVINGNTNSLSVLGIEASALSKNTTDKITTGDISNYTPSIPSTPRA